MLSKLFRKFSFESPEMKASYFLFNREVEIKLLSFAQAIATITFSVLTLLGILYGIGLRESIIRVALVLSSFIIYLIRRRWLNIYKLMMTILGGGLMLYMMIIITKTYNITNGNNQAFFLSGNLIGLFEIIFVLSFKTLGFRFFVYAMLFILKIIFLYEELKTRPYMYVQCFFSMLQIFIFCVYHDILDRKNFSMIYKAGEKIKKFQDLLSNDLPSSVMIMSSNFGSILYSNKFFQQKFAHDGSTESTTKIIKDLFGKLLLQVEDKTSKLEGSHKQTSLLDYLIEITMGTLPIQDQEQVRTLYASYINEEGHELHYEVILRKILWDEKPSYAIVMNDVTDKQMVTALKIADSQKDRVIATVSHGLRTPINGIVGLLEMSIELVTDKTLVNYLENCKSCSKLLLYLVNAILDLSQLRNNALKIAKTTFNLTEMLNELRSLYIFSSLQKGIEFIIEKDPLVNEEIYTDKYRLLEILINLLGNAMKFTFRGSVKLKISKSTQRKDALNFCVEDTGIGIMDQDKTKLFKFFGKIEQANKNINTHGAGLGLTIANELVKALNDSCFEERIMFESEYNIGSRFWFDLAIAKPVERSSISRNDNFEMNISSDGLDSEDFIEFLDPSYSACFKFEKSGFQNHLNSDINPFHSPCRGEDTSISPLSSVATSRQVLLIDDNPLNLLAAGFILEKMNFSVTKALNGQEGIKLLEESAKKGEKFVLVLTDIQMPIMDGLEMSKKIKEKIKRQEIYPVPIIALTAKKLDRKEVEKYEECGIAWSLEKPLVRVEIEKVISKLFENSNNRRI